ncbi:hypothetical protein I9189_010800 [Acinetobacter bereziniae]|uniref:hypothetical protein n=1 Tax=Acinetobacter TaxID=469 RepID=UPI0019071B46|nr:hypothetical protein [Acinetobacter bereziniae]QQC82484.1 hypothetical protein I9192_10680 [Acinetobacter bereziniae]QQC82494.1 hypothetical protein I9192_10730 [Acinetobacter bereziniae]QQC82513.1 hypothetical protein I9192_10840 [Acinetobacter bereziniae]QQC82522.1 hypothetical protein I9192_10890 [Acinetobacter bereziniae]QQC82531.1 hypothetical protein I9192_10940 [Acinetobacter bereziniae]
MSQQMKVTLVGAKSTDWKSEDGRHYDHVTLFGIIPMDTSQGNAVGQGVAEFKWQDSRNLVQLQGRKFPFEVTLELDLVSTGRTTKQVLTNVILPPKS